MVASVLVVGAALSMTVHNAKHRMVDQETYLALVACKNNLEELRTIPFANLPSMNGTGFDVPTKDGKPGGLTPVPGDPDGLAGEFSVLVDQTSGGETIYHVKASVAWVGAQGRQNFTLETLMEERQ